MLIIRTTDFGRQIFLSLFFNLLKAQSSRYIPAGLNSVILRSAHVVHLCAFCLSEQTAIISWYSINGLIFTKGTECVYCAVRTECLRIEYNLSLYRVKCEMCIFLFSYLQTRRSCLSFISFVFPFVLFSVVVRRSYPASGFEGSGLKSEPEDRFHWLSFLSFLWIY